MRFVVLERSGEEIRRALFSGDQRRPGYGADIKDLCVRDRALRREHRIRILRPHNHIDLVALDQLVDRLERNVGLKLVVFPKHRSVQAAQLAAEGFDAEHEAVEDLLSRCRARPRERTDQADLEIAGLRANIRAVERKNCGHNCRD